MGGIFVGALYALFNAGLVISYRQSRLINFAHGAVAGLAAFVAYSLVNAGLPWLVGLLAAVLVGATAEGLLEFVVIRRMPWASEWTGSVSAVGAALFVVGVIAVAWGTSPETLPPLVSATTGFRLANVYIGLEQVLILAVALAVYAGLAVLVHWTRFGLMMRATSEGPLTAGMLGVPVPKIRTLSWVLAGALGGLAGVLITPEYYLTPEFLLLFSVSAFPGFVIGGLESIWGALIGSLLSGVALSVISYYIGTGWDYPAALGIVLLVLTFMPYGIMGRKTTRVPEPRIEVRRVAGLRLRPDRVATRIAGYPVRRRVAAGYARLIRSRMTFRRLGRPERLLMGAVLTVAVLVLPPLVLGSSPLYDLVLVGALYPAVVGQKVISGDSGQISVGTSGFMVVGGYAATLMILHLHVNDLLALAVAMVVSAMCGVMLSAGSSHLSGGYIALVTLMFALAVPEAVGAVGGVTGSFSGLSLPVTRVLWIRMLTPSDMYIVMAAFCLILSATLAWSTGGAQGRRWHAVRDSEAGAAACGIAVRRTKMEAFAVGGALAGLGGALSAIVVSFMSPESYTFFTSIYLLAAVVVGGPSSLVGALIGAMIVVLIPIAVSSSGNYPDVIFGIIIVLVMLTVPTGVVSGRRGKGRILSVAEGKQATGVQVDPSMGSAEVQSAGTHAGT